MDERILIFDIKTAPNFPYPNKVDNGKTESFISTDEKTFVKRVEGSEVGSINMIFPFRDFLGLDINNKRLIPV